MMGHTTPCSGTPPARVLRLPGGRQYELPIFLPVYQQNTSLVPIDTWVPTYGVEGCIVNAFFLYKAREVRARFEQGLSLTEFLGLSGLVMTDSGAFQGFVRQLFLSNDVIVRFQEMIGADIVSPLDLVTPPSDNRSTAQRKLEVTLKRIAEALPLVSRAVLAGVQQGGRFLDLRRQSMETLVRLGVRYVALGSLVPFFTRNHDLLLAGKVLREARTIAGPELPIHVFGSGDPVELPFLAMLGADVFDSSSYAHYARRGCYMTPYGAVADLAPIRDEYACACHVCSAAEDRARLLGDFPRLAAHNLWTICQTIRRVRELRAGGGLEGYLEHVLEVHARWFPDSKLPQSWQTLHEQP